MSTAIADFLSALTQSLAGPHFVRLALTDYTGAEPALKQLLARKILVKRQEKLSVTYRYKTRDIVKNYTFAEAATRIAQALETGFQAATLFTTQGDVHVTCKPGHAAVLKRTEASEQSPPALDHDRSKKRLIDARGQSYLHALGLTDAAGNVHKNAQDKFRQINKYIEILSGLIAALPATERLNIVDMGSGKGYLTFALYDYVVHTLGRAAHVTGVETRADMVALCNRIAVDAGFEDLRFAQQTIAAFDCTGADIVIALHACDTATDDALHQAVVAGASLIVVAPCCHKQIRREMAQSVVTNELHFLTRHGTYLERQAEMVTDGMRVQLLEHAGYHAKLFEFIGGEHTPKNVMIVASRTERGASAQAPLDAFRASKRYFGIGYHHLERLLGL